MKNTMHKKHISAAVALLGCAVSVSALAQSGGDYSASNRAFNPSWYIAPSINTMRPDAGFGSDHRGGGYGLRFGKALSPAWDIQFGPTESRQRFGGVRYQQNTMGVDGLFMFSRERFRPFVLLGAGLENDKVNIYRRSFQTQRTSPYVNAGVGFQFAFTDRWGMQADVRRAHSYLRSNNFGFDRANTNIGTLALTYTFDRRAAPLPIARTTPPEPSVAPSTTVVVTPPVAVAPAPTSAPPPRFERITLSATELFAFDRADLRMPQPKLDDAIAALRSNTQINNVTITGYTDRLGSEKYNMRLSQRRADAVKAYMVNKGIAANRLTTVAKGESNPVVVCTDKKRSDLIKCLEPNRRVEVEQIGIERRVQ